MTWKRSEGVATWSVVGVATWSVVGVASAMASNSEAPATVDMYAPWSLANLTKDLAVTGRCPALPNDSHLASPYSRLLYLGLRWLHSSHSSNPSPSVS